MYINQSLEVYSKTFNTKPIIRTPKTIQKICEGEDFDLSWEIFGHRVVWREGVVTTIDFSSSLIIPRGSYTRLIPTNAKTINWLLPDGRQEKRSSSLIVDLIVRQRAQTAFGFFARNRE